ncbi:hypothetical protein M1K46_21170 [Fictibacillus sp. WQ 8-8]|nr:hypothetical protein [Fictibacillus sp. WQ 8-8]MCQ6268130.1 hypothetical protein [Fictibacillus sp. WQ 8-8]
MSIELKKVLIKMPIVSSYFIPKVAILDPNLLLNLAPKLVASQEWML